MKLLAESGKMSEDEVTNHLLETGGIEFLVAGAEAIGKDRAKTPRMVKAAAGVCNRAGEREGRLWNETEGRTCCLILAPAEEVMRQMKCEGIVNDLDMQICYIDEAGDTGAIQCNVRMWKYEIAKVRN